MNKLSEDPLTNPTTEKQNREENRKEQSSLPSQWQAAIQETLVTLK